MFIGIFKNTDKKIENYLYNDMKAWLKDTWNPSIEIIGLLDFKINGKIYTEKKANLEDLAKDWQNNFAYYPWSYGELAEIENYFLKNAKRYGLLKEFHENGIC